MKYVIWDWNGTLFDDVDLCFKSMNLLLKKYNVAPIADISEYQSKFCFPVEEYYQKIGFDFSKTPFTQLAKEFMELYQPKSLHCALNKGVNTILPFLQNKGFRQVILSASKRDNLCQQVYSHKIEQYFENVLGIGDIFAKTKIDIATTWIHNTKTQPSNLLFVGDTLHDYEVAREIGCKCVLYSRGHQSIDGKDIESGLLINDLEKVGDICDSLWIQ
ncbi:MAG: HAD family hydrolase [Anaerolineales bacterium]|nr:HAD family hydrolase [Anaerolineales bacterium]